MEDVKIVAVQYKSILGNIRANVIKIKNIIKNIMKEQPDSRLIVFPELALSGYNCFEEMKNIAETIEGDAIKDICGIAKEEKVSLIVGYPERDVYEDKIYNLDYMSSDEIEELLKKVTESRKQNFTQGKKIISK